MKKLIIWLLILLCVGLSLSSCSIEDIPKSDNTKNSKVSTSVTQEAEILNEEQDDNKTIISVDYPLTTIFDGYECSLKFNSLNISFEQGFKDIRLTFNIDLINNSSRDITFTLPSLLENSKLNGTILFPETPYSSKKYKNDTQYTVNPKETKNIIHVVNCIALDGIDLDSLSSKDVLEIPFRYAADKNATSPVYIGENIYINKQDNNEENSIATENKEDNFITSENSCFCKEFDPIDCGGITFNMNKLKVCADLSNPSSDYNFYYIVYEYTLINSTLNELDWKIGNGNSNYYGTFVFNKYERKLGGNRFIKDEDIVSPWQSNGTLQAGEQKTYSMVLVVDREHDDPDDGLMLQTNSTMKVVLPFDTTNCNYELTFSIN